MRLCIGKKEAAPNDFVAVVAVSDGGRHKDDDQMAVGTRMVAEGKSCFRVLADTSSQILRASTSEK